MRRRVNILVAVLCLLTIAACQSVKGGTVQSADDWTTTRQQQIDLVTQIAHETSTDAYVVAESIGACETGDDLDDTIASSDYFIAARPVPETQTKLDQVVAPRLKADGWAFHDKTQDANQPEGTTLSYVWSKGDAAIIVRISPGIEDRPIIRLSGSSECGKRGNVLSGEVQRDDPWYIAPRVEGPTIDDNHTPE